MSHDIWEMEGEGLTRGKGFLLSRGQIAIMVLREFIADKCLLQASALTYATLLAIVPLFALTFSVLSGLGVQNTLQPILLEQLTIGSEEIVNQIIHYINNTNFARLGVVGLIALIVTVIALLTNIEASLNGVWGVGESRSMFRRFADFTSVLLLGPVFLFAAISMTSTLKNQGLVQSLLEWAVLGEILLFLFRILPYLAMWAAFIFLYVFMPTAKVQLKAAVIGGIFGGTIWQLAQWGYINFQVGVSRYNAIYGTMAAVPILMIWIYISWLIVLLGAEVAYVWQNQKTILREIRAEKIDFLSQEMVALTVMMRVTQNFYQTEKPWRMEKIAEVLHLPPSLGREVIGELAALGYLTEVYDGKDRNLYQPARPPEDVQVADLLQDYRGSGTNIGRRETGSEWRSVRDLEERLQAAQTEVLSGLTLKELALQGITQEDQEGQAEGSEPA